MANLELSKNDLTMIVDALIKDRYDTEKTIKIYSEGDIDRHYLDDPTETTYREEIEKFKNSLKDNQNLTYKLIRAIKNLD